MKPLSKRAMTFVEVMVALLISTFIIGGLYTTLLVSNRSWLVYSDSVILKQELRRVLFVLSNDLRESKNFHVDEDADELAVTFYRPAKGEITYRWQKTGEKAHQLTRSISSNEERILAQNISGLSAQENLGVITLELLARKKSFAGQDIEVQIGQKVALRYKSPIFK